jgi:NodT family efflux transporter outer membrane factor (OMF) lipoprotein
MRRLALVVAVGAGVAGCAVGPDFQRPAAPAAQTYRATPATIEDQRLVAGAAVPADWWHSFGSAPLDELVRRALAANPSIDAARAALRAAEANLAAQRGAFWPQVSASLAPSRQKIADSLSSPLNAPVNPYSLHTAQVSVAYAPDVFGAARRQVESLAALAEAQRQELHAARLSLAANVVLGAVQEAALRGQLAALDKIVALDEEMLALTRRQFALGAVAEAAVVAQEAALAQARAALPALQKQLAQNRDLLVALAGGYPDRDLEQRFDLDQLTLPRELPLSLPAQLVAQRPDVLAAEAQARAASAQIGVAFANRLPQFGIDANLGSVAAHLADLFKGGGFWGVGATIAQPIFQGGALVQRQAAAQAGYDLALAQYRTTVIAAMQNVADTLHALEQDAAAERASATAERLAARSLAIARRGMELGDTSHLALLGAEQAYQQSLLALVQARASRYADVAALFQALGGGWWHESAEVAGRQ